MSVFPFVVWTSLLRQSITPSQKHTYTIWTDSEIWGSCDTGIHYESWQTTDINVNHHHDDKFRRKFHEKGDINEFASDTNPKKGGWGTVPHCCKVFVD